MSDHITIEATQIEGRLRMVEGDLLWLRNQDLKNEYYVLEQYVANHSDAQQLRIRKRAALIAEHHRLTCALTNALFPMGDGPAYDLDDCAEEGLPVLTLDTIARVLEAA